MAIFHVSGSSDELISTRYPVISEPPLSPGSHRSSADMDRLLHDTIFRLCGASGGTGIKFQ